MKLAEKFISILESQVDRGIYVWGGNGEPVSDYENEQLNIYLEKREVPNGGKTKAENIARDRKLLEKRIKKLGEHPSPPIRAFDCSGLMYYAGKAVGIFEKDLNADSIFKKCREVKKDDLQRGDFVFQHNGAKATHVGMFIGSGKAIECEGRDSGVVKKKFRKQFNRFGRLDAMNNLEEETTQTPGELLVRVKGNSRRTVRVRKGPGSSFPKLFTARGGQFFPLLEIDQKTGWYAIALDGGETGYVSNRKDLTEVIES